jgi:nifR3 family TIM-barrel protein
MPGKESGFQVGDIPIEGRSILAPMDGYSSWPFRSLCRDMGSAISYTEFVKAEDVLDRPGYIEKKLYYTEAERPIIFQLYGHNPGTILGAALHLQDLGPDAIDINLGCPNRSIVSRGAGAGLLREPKKVARIIKLLTSSLDIPVTAKIRLGWNDCQKQLLIARIIQECGGGLVAVHARTKEQGHHGAPDLSGIAEIKQALIIPVIGNGGLEKVNDIGVMEDQTGCDGVMIGRGAIANPWIFSGLDREEISPEQVQELMLDHLDRSARFYGAPDGLITFRKFTAGYLSPYSIKAEKRRGLLTETDPEIFLARLREIFNNIGY